MSTFVKNVLFLLFFVFFASGIFYMSTNPSFIHFSEKIFLGEVNEKTHILSGTLSLELDDSLDADEAIL